MVLHDIHILKIMNHPLVIQIREGFFEVNNIVTDFVAKGSLADHLSGAEKADLSQLSGFDQKYADYCRNCLLNALHPFAKHCSR
jgi:hypothetical protein